MYRFLNDSYLCQQRQFLYRYIESALFTSLNGGLWQVKKCHFIGKNGNNEETSQNT